MTNPRKAVFDEVRKIVPSGTFNDPGNIYALDTILDALGAKREQRVKRALRFPDLFFAKLRDITGSLDQEQVDSINAILQHAAHWPLGWVAYASATAWHEARFKPQPEWGKGKGRPYAVPGKHGQAQYGRGLVQLTWDRNYEWADKALELDGALLRNFDLALQPDIAVRILVRGMEEGAFARDGGGRHTLERHVKSEKGTHSEFINARRIINGVDRNVQIANEAEQFRDALVAGEWA